ncbi:hypothetical protein LJR235_002923 [Pararhizobium sp. LjRoot235]
MTRPVGRPTIEIFPSTQSPRDPNEWLRIAATIFFALGLAVAFQL